MIVAANFKANHTRENTASYLEALNLFLDACPSSCDVRVYPPLTAFLRADLSEHAKVGAQNFYPSRNGAYTGEIGLEQLEEFEIKSVLIGHSERRITLKESQELIAKKFAFAKENGLEIIYCIGEPKVVRDGGFDAVMEYLWAEFDGIDTSYENFSVAYEPIWAIGTGVSAETEDIAKVLDTLKKRLVSTPLLYGGSVNRDNLTPIVSLKSCDGVLVGTASLDVANFCKLIQIAQDARK